MENLVYYVNYRQLPSFTVYYRLLPSITVCYCLLPSITVYYRSLPYITVCYRLSVIPSKIIWPAGRRKLAYDPSNFYDRGDVWITTACKRAGIGCKDEGVSEGAVGRRESESSASGEHRQGKQLFIFGGIQ